MSGKRRFLTVVLTGILPLLAGCGGLPELPLMGGNYKPLTQDIALMAAPVDPAGGRPVICQAGGGTARFGKGWLDMEPVRFVLSPGVKTPVAISPQRGSGTAPLQAWFDAEGQKMIFCPAVSGQDPDDRIACASLYALEDDLQMGIKRTFDVPDAVRGASITCAYSKASLQKL